MRKVDIVTHDPTWQEAFETEAQQITCALGEAVVGIHHIGSTAIPGIYAKPIIDVLVEVKDITSVDGQQAVMESLGYESMGEFGIAGRRYFRKENQDGVRTHHIHVFEVGSAEIASHLAFRDYMNAHPEDAQRYSELKRELARQHPTNIDRYMDGKDGFIKAIDAQAAQWRALQSSSSQHGMSQPSNDSCVDTQTPLPEALVHIFEQFTEPEALLTALVAAMGVVLPCDRCFLYLREPTQNCGKITHCWSRDGHAAEWIGADWLEDPNAPEDPLMTIALRTPVAVFVEDVETAGSDVVDRLYEREKFQHQALVHAPIYQDEALIGILECSIFDAPRVWTEGDRQLIAFLQAKLTAPTAAYIQQYQPFQH